MNFFEDQRIAKEKTDKLLRTFFILIISVSLVSGIAINFLFGFFFKHSNTLEYTQRTISFEQLFTQDSLMISGVIALIIGLIILLISFIKTLDLKSKPEKICESLGAVKLNKKSDDFKEIRYKNIVEEMSIASSVPMPLIYILEDDAINAFACGYDINSAAICVTRGTLDSLNREELQAVVAHEYSHILNGDMNINLRLIGMLAGLLFIYYIGRFLLRSGGRSRSRSKNGNQAALVGIVFVILGLVGFLFGNILKAAISRQREYLADASSVQFTRNPDGITGALKKIAVNYNQGIVKSAHAEEAAHMFLVSGIKRDFFSTATHPDIYDRIKAIDKNFNKQKFVKNEYKSVEKKLLEVRSQTEPSKEESTQMNHNKIVQDKVKLLLPLYLILENTLETKEGESIEESLLRKLVANEDPQIKALSSMKKLELLEIAFGEIRAMDDKTKEHLHLCVKDEIRKDGQFDFDEFIIYAYLKPALRTVKIKYKSLTKRELEVFGNMVMNFLLHCDDHELTIHDKNEISKFFPFQLLKPEDVSYSQILKVLNKFRFASIGQRQFLLKAAYKLIHMNNHVSEKEEVVLILLKQILGVPGNTDIGS